ncbi:NAD(P)H-hydrate epimerase [Micromonospora sp. DT81.3]|uniref:NAD(P)H-hydrate epimerase n=1 Tax=Micromonospora sp. DT81.3 TaxID=3416523 RepID=UPI003CF8E29E
MAESAPVYLAAQVRAAEKPLLDAGEPLMLRAAGALARIALGELGARGGRVLVLAGSGDNGGDALFAGAHLAAEAGVAVDLLLTSDRVHTAGFEAAVEAGARTIGLAEAVSAASGHDLLLDGILGIGASTSAALRGDARVIVAGLLPAVHAGRPRVIAVDVPSGLQPDDGSSDDVVLPASVTVTFGAVKAGLVRGRGPELAGRIVLVDIGLGPRLAAAGSVGTAAVAAIVQGGG